jgi:2-desacetyl-2-hydroxyethyl bacteriochlorophyllide A dehydrogenase
MPRQITAVVFGKPGQITVEKFDLCPCGPEDVVVRSLYTTVSSGTELRALGSEHKPFIPGYAVIGEVVELGEKVKAYQVGDLVSGRSCPRFVQGINSPCGGHASFHVFPATGEDRPVLLPPGAKPLDYIVSELGSITLRGVEAAQPEPGETVIVVGQGMIGALSAAWFHARGCKVIVTDVEQRRLDRAMKWGAYAAVKSGPDAQARLLAYVNRGADIVVEASGSAPGTLLAFQLIRATPLGHPGGTPHYRGETIGRLAGQWPRLVMPATTTASRSIRTAFIPAKASPSSRPATARTRIAFAPWRAFARATSTPPISSTASSATRKLPPPTPLSATTKTPTSRSSSIGRSSRSGSRRCPSRRRPHQRPECLPVSRSSAPVPKFHFPSFPNSVWERLRSPTTPLSPPQQRPARNAEQPMKLPTGPCRIPKQSLGTREESK